MIHVRILKWAQRKQDIYESNLKMMCWRLHHWEVITTENVDKTINILCNWIQKNITEDGSDIENQENVLEMIKALADLV